MATYEEITKKSEEAANNQLAAEVKEWNECIYALRASDLANVNRQDNRSSSQKKFNGKECDKMSDKFLNDEQEKALEELLNLLRKMPKKKFLTLNKPRFDEVAKSISKIVKLVKEDYPDAQVTVEFDELTEASVFLTIITDEFNVYKVKDFCAAIAPANTMNFTPRLDEKLEIGVTYDDVKFPVKPRQ